MEERGSISFQAPAQAPSDVLVPLRPNDPVVALIHTALVGLNVVHETARRVVRRLRK